jgi:hypothetical protein
MLLVIWLRNCDKITKLSHETKCNLTLLLIMKFLHPWHNKLVQKTWNAFTVSWLYISVSEFITWVFCCIIHLQNGLAGSMLYYCNQFHIILMTISISFFLLPNRYWWLFSWMRRGPEYDTDSLSPSSTKVETVEPHLYIPYTCWCIILRHRETFISYLPEIVLCYRHM